MKNKTRRQFLGVIFLCIGLLLAIEGFRAQGRTRTNVEDNIAWGIWAIGMSLLAAGVTVLIAPSVRAMVLIPVAIACPFVVFALLVGIYWGAIVSGFGAWPSQTAMVTSGYQKIPEARQIDELFGPAWHSIANFKDPDIVDWITEAILEDRYELTMYVPAKVDRQTGELIEVVGKPQISLQEVDSVQGRAISYGQSYEISPDDWQKVVAAGGDFAVIGISIKADSPVPGFAEIQNRPRNGIRLKAD